jgi:hypothetical protein
VINRTSSSSALRAALCALVLTGGGCSYAFVDGPPANHARLPYFECDSSKVWPVVDVVFAASLGIGTAGAISDGGSSSSSDGVTTAVVTAAEAALFAVSALSGYRKVAECREAKDQLIARAASAPQYAAAPSRRAPPPDPWVTPPPGLFAPRAAALPPTAPAVGSESDATATETPDPVPARPVPAIPVQTDDLETPR